MESLPEELLEIVFSFLSPYKEYNIAACVCKTWQRIINGMAKHSPFKFEQSLINGSIEWFSVVEGMQPTSVSPRTGQALCYNDFTRSIYVFGGKSLSSSGAGFNDLLKLDMHLLSWQRPIVKGPIPPPKFGCSLNSYKHYLILFGGSFLEPPVNSLRQRNARYSNDLHIYNVKEHTWTHKPFLSNECPSEVYAPKTCLVADHDDCDLDVMLMYGGWTKSLQKVANKELWCLHLTTWIWEKQVIISDNESNTFDISRTSINEFKSPTHSSAVIILGHSQDTLLPQLWLLCRTGLKEWTLQNLNISSNISTPFSNFNFDMPCLTLGRTLILFRSTCIERALPNMLSVKGPKLLHSTVKYEHYSKRNAAKSSQQTFSTTSVSSSSTFSSSKLFMFLLDLSDVENNNLVKCVHQLDPDSGRLLPCYVGLGIASNVLAVIGRGEIILHDLVKSGNSSHMSLSIIRSQR